MKLGHRPPCLVTMIRLRTTQRNTVQESQDRCGTPVKHARHAAVAGVDGHRAAYAAPRQVLHQPEIERQILGRNAHFIERQDVRSRACLKEVVGIRHAFGDSFEDMRFAEVITGQKRVEFFDGDVGVNRHAPMSHSDSAIY